MRLTLSINVLRIGCMGNNAMILTEETKKDYTGIGILIEEKKKGRGKIWSRNMDINCRILLM